MEEVKRFRDQNCDQDSNQKNDSITKSEKKGIRELLKKIKDEEIIVLKTDKSHKLSIIVIDMYEKLGKNHTDKDREIRWEDVMFKQRRITGFTRGICKAMGVGESWGSRNIERCLESSLFLKSPPRITSL